jgi:hypothetical protein
MSAIQNLHSFGKPGEGRGFGWDSEEFRARRCGSRKASAPDFGNLGRKKGVRAREVKTWVLGVGPYLRPEGAGGRSALEWAWRFGWRIF